MKTGIRIKPIHFLLIILISAALLIGAVFAAVSLSGFRYTTYKTETQGDIRFIGRVDKQDHPISGKVFFSDGSEASLERAGTSLVLKNGSAVNPDSGYIYKLSYDDGSVYTGTVVGMLRHGKGSITFAGGDIYEGDFAYGKITGEGSYYYLSGDIYVGNFEDGKKSGEGKYTWAPDNLGKSDVFVGSYFDDMRNGSGTYTWADGSIYVGTYVNDAKQGEGKLTFAGGDTYEGTFLDDMRTGKGTYTWKSGETYVGDFLKNTVTGYGKYSWTSGSNRLSYEGYFENGKIVFVDDQPNEPQDDPEKTPDDQNNSSNS